MEVSSDEDDEELPTAKKSRRQQANDGSSAVQMQKVGPSLHKYTFVVQGEELDYLLSLSWQKRLDTLE